MTIDKDKAFRDFVELGINNMSKVQQAHTQVEQAMLAIRNDNTCENHIKLVLASKAYEAATASVVNNVEQIGEAHADIKHEKTPDEARDAQAMEAFVDHIMTVLFGGGNNGRAS